jgi:hypothetical protein
MHRPLPTQMSSLLVFLTGIPAQRLFLSRNRGAYTDRGRSIVIVCCVLWRAGTQLRSAPCRVGAGLLSRMKAWMGRNEKDRLQQQLGIVESKITSLWADQRDVASLANHIPVQ